MAVIVVLLGGAGPAAVLAQPETIREKIVWAALDFPPFQIVAGPHRGSGSFDGLRDLLVREIGDADHELVTMTFARREDELRKGAMLCSPGMFRTPVRERYLVFSKPALIHLDNRLVFLGKNASRFPPGAAVDLEKLFKDRRLVGGIIAGRSFAPNIDASIRHHGGSPNLEMRALKPSQVIELLLSGEIDYTIMFPHEAAFLEQQAGRSGWLSNRPIAGTPPYIVTHVACTRGEWGERVVARVDRILRGQRNHPEYRRFSERWYSAADQLLIRWHYPRLAEADAEPPR
ncbi:MAG: TIGR02285 family protein [Rhodocyclales bacterium]|nr:TIGR02285 family protein [Rhodocyclales bacterium]